MMSWPLDLVDGLRQALGSSGPRAVGNLLAATLAPGESGALFVATDSEPRLVAAVPGPEPFAGPPVRALVARALAGREAVEATGALVVPVTVEGQAAAALAVLTIGAAGLSAASRARAPLLAPLLAVVGALDLARGHAREREAEVGHIRQVLSLAKPGRTLPEVSQALLDLAAELLDGDAGGLWLRTRRAGDLELSAARRPLGRRSPRPALTRAEVEPLIGAAPLYCPPSPIALPRALLRDDALGAAVSIPLHHDGDLVGLLVVARPEGGPSFEEHAGRRVLELTELATVPIVNVCLRDELRERIRQLRARRRIAQAIAAGATLDEVFRVATRALARTTPFDGAVLAVTSETGEGGQVVVGEPAKLPRGVAWTPVLQEALAGSGLRAGRALIVPDLAATTRPIRPLLRDVGDARAVLGMPLVVGRETVGALLLVSRTRGRFRRADLRRVRPVVEQLAIAVRDARVRRAATVGAEDRLRLETRLAGAERHATIGRLAGALAHEIRNPLTVIGTTVQYLRDRLPPDHEHRPLLDAADRKVREMDESLENLLSLARPIQLRLRPIAVVDLLEAVVEFVRGRAGRQGVEVAVERERDLPPALLDPRLMEQAFLNLALNALDAMPSGGRLTFAVVAAPESGNLVVTVADTGAGIEDAQLRAIFEPYFTSKRRGTGLGLAITRRIVEEHGGAIEAASEPGRGTTFTVILPPAPPDPAGAARS
ncbi:MAG TPA: ATP-binding protein [Methylomirabilota bacterium]|jgi:signal transduction histidine kinase|nr:ATP-binding protein [Methylomirabilota bacterium]